MKPQTAIADILSKGGPTLKAIDPFLEIPDVFYIVNETPASTTSGSPASRIIVAPKGFDNPVERLANVDYPPTS